MSEGSHQKAAPEQNPARLESPVREAEGNSHRPAGAEAPKTEPRSADKRGQSLIKSGQRPGEHRSGLQRTAAAIRTMVPLVQKMLPLLEGNVVSAAANLLAPGLGTPVIDLAPLEASLAQLRGELASTELRNAEHDRAFKRMDEQLETMKDTLDRSTHEQRQTAEEMRRLRVRVAAFSVVGAALLLVSIGVNAALFWYVKGLAH